MSIKPVLSFRGLTLVTFVLSLLGIATFAFGERIFPTVLTEIFYASAAGQDSRVETEKASTNTAEKHRPTVWKALGADDRIIFGVGDRGRWDVNRVDKVQMLAPMGTPQDLATLKDFEPSWSADGSKIAFVSLRNHPPFDNTYTIDNYRRIYTMNADGSDQTLAAGGLLGPESEPSFSPDGEKIVFVAQYSGYDPGIYTVDIHGNGTATRVDTTACMPNGLHGWKSGGTRNITQSDSSQPGFLGYDTPNFSPNGDWIIFGKIERGIIGLLPYGNYVYKVPANGSGGCSVLYEPQSASSSPPTAARYSPDGTKVSLYHVEGFGETAVRKLRIINATTGAIIEDHTPVEFFGNAVWSPGGTKVAYPTGYYDTKLQQDVVGQRIGTYDLTSWTSETVFDSMGADGVRGLSWGTPPAAGPALSLRINQPNPVTSGTSTTATVYLNEPAPTGGVTVSLQALGAIGAMTVPSSVVIAEGETQAVFTIDTEISNLYRSAEVLATRPSPNFAQAQATVSLAPAKPDLRAVSLTVPPAVGVNQGFDISWVVDNIGEASTGTNGGVDAIYLSTDDILTGSDTLLYSQPNPASLAVGASRTVSGFQLSIADYLATQPGLYYLILYTNPFGAIDEAGRTSNNTVTIPIQVNYPDLVIENLAVPANTEPNVPFTVTFNIRNIGGANAANPFNTRISVSTDAFFGNSDDSTLANINLNSLAAGATSAQSRSVTIPTVPSRPNGTIYIFVKADTDNTIIEGSQITPEEINNTSSQTTQFEYRVPDLQVTSTSTAVEVDTDAAFPMTWTTTNTGNKAAGTFSESVYFSPDNQVGSDLLLGTFPLPGGLAAGASVERIQNVTIPTGAIPTSGDHYVYVLTDSPSVINEGENENNNSRFQPVFVRRLLRPDLVITNITAPPTAFFDQTIQVQWTVTNNGLGPTNALAWKDRVSVNTTGSSTTNALIDVDSAGALAPGESYIASATVKIPRGFNGSYLFVVTTDINGALNEENTTNNKLTRAITLNIPPLPDLTVSNVQAPVQAFAGGPINVGWQVNNIGNAAAAGDNEALNKPWSWADKVYLSRDTVLNTSQDRLIFTKSTRTTPLPAGANYTTNTFVATTTGGDYVKLPNDVQGQYYVFVVADTNNTIYEFSAENNNFAYDEVAPGSPINIIQTPPDLVINAQPAAPSTASGGQFIDISFTVSNQGAFPTAGNWTDAIYLSTDQTYGADDTILGTKPTSSLAAGESRLVEMRVQLPTCVLTGDYYLIARTDTGNMVGEFDPGYDAEANNYSPVRPISITTLPADLIASNVQFSPITTPGQSVSVSWTESNIGTGPGPYQWTDRVLITSLEGLGSSEIGRATHQGAIAAGQSASRNANVNLPSYMQGEYVITIETDYNRNVIECGTGEDNNTASSGPFSVANNLPDVVVDSVSVPAGPIQVGTSFPVGYTGRNAGGQLTTFGGWHDVVYLSSDASLSASDIRIGNVSQQDNLAPGQTYSQTVNVSTGNVAAGQYYILVVADIDNNVYEGPYNSIYEGNNLRESTPIIVTSPDVDLQAVVNSVTTPTYSGTNVIINWTVTNTGGTSTLGSSWTDYIILSRDSVIDSTDKRLGYVVHNGALAGGANYSESRSIGIPAGLTDLYRIFVVTDYNNSVSESSDSNNISPAYNVNLELPPPADLNVTNISVPAGATPGDGAFFQWTVQNSGTYPAIGPWRDSVYLSRDQFWDASDYLIGQKDRTGLPLGPSATEVESTGFTIPFIEEGDYYVIVRLDSQNRVRESNEANNVLTSVSQMPITVQALTLNTPFMTTLLNGGQKSFRFDAPADETIVVSLDGETGNSNELFTNFYSAASRADYDFQGSGERTADQENVIGNTYEGRYYSMVSHDFIQPQNVLFDKQPEKVVNGQIGTIPVPPQNISITANLLPFSIRQVSPAVAGNQGEITISVDGAKFASGATVMLVGADTSVITPRITKNSSSRIVALFDLKEKAAGDYDVVVTNPNNQTTTRTDGFKIVNGGGHSLRHSAIGPSAARIGNARARFTFTVHNDGLNDAFAVPLMIAFPTNVAYELDRGNYFDMPAELLPQGMPPMELTFDSDGKRYLFLIAPIVRSKREINVNIDFTMTFLDPLKIGFGILPPLLEVLQAGQPSAEELANLTRLTSPNALTPGELCLVDFSRAMFFAMLSLFPGAGCGPLLITVIPVVDNISGLAMSYIANDKLSFGDVVTTGIGLFLGVIDDIGQCVGNELPYIKFANAVWTIGNLIKTYISCILAEYEYDVSRIRAVDPNEKLGPKGFGTEGFVPIGREMLYRINFENVSSATGPAQKVIITDQLPPTLDPRTVRLKEIGFKQNVVVVPNNQAYYQSRIQLGSDLNDLYADISAGLDIVNGKVTWTLNAIDPQTGETPLDPTFGILPPNNEDHDGEGFVTFTIQPKATYPNRTAINNSATIIFDENEPIVTNTTANLLDSVVPMSTVAPLPATLDSPGISFSWSGTDDADGSGFDRCEIRVSTNGGAFIPIFSETNLVGSSNFTGRWGKHYAFQSICSDFAGNVEMAPTQPDAETTVLGGDTEGDVSPRPNGNDGQVASDDVAQIRRFITKLDTVMAYNEFQRSDTAPRLDGGNGALSVADVIQARRYAASLDQRAEAAGPNDALPYSPKPVPGKRSSLLPREVKPVSLYRDGTKVIIGVDIEAQGDEAAIGFALNFDTAVLSSPSLIELGPDASGAVLTVNDSQAASGKLGIAIDKAPGSPFAAGTRRVLYVAFEVAPVHPDTTNISFVSDPVITEVVDGTATPLSTVFSAADISLLAPTAANASIEGTVTRANGSGLSGATVVLGGVQGSRRSVLTNGFGRFRFDDVTVGETYTIDVRAKGLMFRSRLITVTEDVTGLEIGPEP